MSRQRVGQIVGDAAREATSKFTARGLTPLPNVYAFRGSRDRVRDSFV